MNITPKAWMQKINFWCKYNEFEVKSEVKRVPLVDLATLQPILENGRQKTGAKEVICIVAKEEEAQEGTPEIEFDDDF